MRDLTRGSIPKHIVAMAVPIAIGILFQTLYYLVDLYYVAALGEAAIAGVGVGGSAQFLVMAMTQIVGVGTMAPIAHAIGRQDFADANLVFNQSLVVAAACAVVTLVGGYAVADAYTAALTADAASAEAGRHYLYAFLPGLALQFALITLSSALRGLGIARPTMVVQMITVLLNVLLARILIAGWLTGHPMGVVGAGLATSLSVAVGVVALWIYFVRKTKVVGLDASLLRVRLPVWGRILRVGLPPGGEFALMFVFIGVTNWVIADFGAAAQAGYSLGSRLMQAIFLPAMAVAFAVVPVVGQNFGAGHIERVRATFRSAAWMSSALMVGVMFFCQWRPEWLVQTFTGDPAVVAVAADFLRIIALNFVAAGLVFTCSGILQGIGNTGPALMSSATRIVTYVLPAVLMARYGSFQLHHFWYLSVTTGGLQALTSLWLVRVALRERLAARMAPAA